MKNKPVKGNWSPWLSGGLERALTIPERHDNRTGLARRAAFDLPPPTPVLLAASTTNVCPQSHVGAQTREPFEPCKQSGPPGMHVRIYRSALCHRWHLFSWPVRAARFFVTGAVEGRCPPTERTHEHQQHPASFSREYETRSCNTAPLCRDVMAYLFTYLRQLSETEMARQHSAPSSWKRQERKAEAAQASAGS